MKILNCPLNGPRNISEFVWGGEVKEMPAPADATARDWADYVFIENNVAGVVREWWCHVPTSFWFIAERNTVTEEIIRNLSVIDGLGVRSRTSSFAFRDKPRDLTKVGKQLGVSLVVVGTVLRSGSRIRVDVQLVQVPGETSLWSDRFDRELTDIRATADDISRAIANRLGLTMP